jgi:hypothetical protein
MIFENKLGMCSFTNCFCIGKHIFKSLHITSWCNQRELTIKRTSHLFAMTRTKSLTNQSYNGVFFSSPLPSKYFVINDGFIACLFLHFPLLPSTLLLGDYALYFTKSFECLFKMCFFINVVLWLSLYCTNPFSNWVVL